MKTNNNIKLIKTLLVLQFNVATNSERLINCRFSNPKNKLLDQVSLKNMLRWLVNKLFSKVIML